MRVTSLILTFTALLAGLLGCRNEDEETTELQVQCMQSLDSLQQTPSHADLVEVAAELQEMGCGDLAVDNDPSILQERAGCNCACDGGYCVCICGKGGACEKIGASTWVCGGQAQ